MSCFAGQNVSGRKLCFLFQEESKINWVNYSIKQLKTDIIQMIDMIQISADDKCWGGSIYENVPYEQRKSSKIRYFGTV